MKTSEVDRGAGISPRHFLDAALLGPQAGLTSFRAARAVGGRAQYRLNHTRRSRYGILWLMQNKNHITPKEPPHALLEATSDCSREPVLP